jgi:hypothetical protein
MIHEGALTQLGLALIIGLAIGWARRAANRALAVPRCMARPRVARQTSKTTNVRCCINVLGLVCGALAPGHHGYPRASEAD